MDTKYVMFFVSWHWEAFVCYEPKESLNPDIYYQQLIRLEGAIEENRLEVEIEKGLFVFHVNVE